MDGYRVDPAQLAAVSGQMRTGAAGIEAELGRLRAAVDSLHGNWVGNAQTRFQTLLEQWQTGARQLHDALSAIAVMTAQAGTAYADTDSQVAAGFSRM
jgi:WXG100 family type VII secretion target